MLNINEYVSMAVSEGYLTIQQGLKVMMNV